MDVFIERVRGSAGGALGERALPGGCAVYRCGRAEARPSRESEVNVI